MINDLNCEAKLIVNNRGGMINRIMDYYFDFQPFPNYQLQNLKSINWPHPFHDISCSIAELELL